MRRPTLTKKEIQERIKRTFELLRKVNNTSWVTVTELAKELSYKKTHLMAYIDNNHKLFNTKYLAEAKNKGLVVAEVYMAPEENYLTDEWLEQMKDINSKYINLSVSDNYGYIQGYYVETDIDTEHRLRYHLWRNTPEKIAQIKEYLHKTVFVYGGFGDSCSISCETAISPDSIKKLQELGWKFSEVPPLSQSN